MSNSVIINAMEAPEMKLFDTSETFGPRSAKEEKARTCCSIGCLNSVLYACDALLRRDDADLHLCYQLFYGKQNEGTRLTLESFKEICKYVNSVLKTEEDWKAMAIFLVINDLGKLVNFVKKVETSIGYESADHDKVLHTGLKAHPEFSPSFASLSERHKKILLEALRISCDFNMGQYVQSENVPASLKPLVNVDKEALDYYMIHVLFDIAGAAGHKCSVGSLVVDEFYWKKFSWALETVGKLNRGSIGPIEAYNTYLQKTGQYFQVSNYEVEKLCNLMRLTTPKEAEELRRAYFTLGENDKLILKTEFGATGDRNDSAILLYYAPLTLQNALGYYRKQNPENAITLTVHKIAPIFSKIYKTIRDKIGSGREGVITVLIEDISTAAKTPEVLSVDMPLNIVRKGDDFIVTRKNSN